MQISSLLRSRLIEFHQEGQLHVETTLDPSISRITQLRLGAYVPDLEAAGAFQFQSNISSTCFERLLQKHHKHHSFFRRPVLVGIKPSTDEGEIWADMQRGVQHVQTVVANHQDQEWGLHARFIQQEQRVQRIASEETNLWLGNHRRDACFMLDHNLRLTLSKTYHSCSHDSLPSTTFEVSLDLLPHIESLTNRSNESSEQYIDRVVIPALRSVMQLIQNTHHPMTVAEAATVQRAFFQLTGTQPHEFIGFKPVPLSGSCLDAMLETNKEQHSALSILLTDVTDQGMAAFIYIHQNIVYLYTIQDGLRRISHSDPHTATWNGSIIIGESSAEDHFFALDILYHNGASFLNDNQHLFAERMDILNLCHTDLRTIYRHAPFVTKTYTFCRDESEVHEGIKRIFDTFSERGPYTIGGVAISDGNQPLKPERLIWSVPSPLRLQFGHINEPPSTLYASGPNETTCLLEEIEVSAQTPYFADQTGIFEFQQSSQNSNPRLQLICLVEENDDLPLDQIDVVLKHQQECKQRIDHAYLEGRKELPVSLVPQRSLPSTQQKLVLPQLTSFRSCIDSIASPIPKVSPLQSPIATPPAPCRKRKKASQESLLSFLLKPTPKRLKTQ